MWLLHRLGRGNGSTRTPAGSGARRPDAHARMNSPWRLRGFNPPPPHLVLVYLFFTLVPTLHRLS